jgi:hypothetical protein
VSANSDVTADPASIAFAGAGSVEEPARRAAHVSDPVEQLAEIIVVVALAGELVAMFGNVISRSLFDISLLWSLEIGELALVVMTFVGGAMPIRGASTWRCMSWFSGCRGAGMPPSMRWDAGKCLRCRRLARL